MAEPLTHINYSFEEIQRYLQGKMSAAEMHAIEKAALQDAFLADAIEGYNEADFTMAQQHLAEINASLIGEKKKSKVVAFNKRFQWLNIAAVVIILAGIGVIASYFFKSSNQQTPIAQVKKEPAKNEAPKDSATDNINRLSKKPDTTLLMAENKSAKKIEPLALKKNVIANRNIEEEKADVASVAAAPAQLNENNVPVMDTPYYNLKSNNNNNDSIQYALQGKVSGLSVLPSTFSGKVTDENSKPIAGAYIQSQDKKTGVLTDANGHFSLQQNDSILNVTASTIGYDAKTAKLQSGNNAPIILKGTNSNLNEVVVTGFASAKKRQSLPDSAMPVGGWQNFNNYVITKLNKDTTSNAFANQEDLVEMEFLIDNNGIPYNLKITKSLDEERNAKAIDILKKGPRWTNTSKKKKAKVTISF
jgi:hypothetical protein